MSVDNFYCFQGVKIHWNIKRKHFFSIFIYVCVWVCLFTNIHEIFMYTYDLTYIALFAKIVLKKIPFLLLFFNYRLWFWRVKIAISGKKKTTIFCTVMLNNIW